MPEHAPARHQPRKFKLYVITGAIVLALISILQSASSITQFTYPFFSSRIFPPNEIARATLAEKMLTDQASDPSGVLATATEALRLAPTNARAIRSLGFAIANTGDYATSKALVVSSLRFSKRDLPTLLWLIEERSAANDVTGTLRLYDYALRARPDSEKMLVPILVAASADPALEAPIARIIRPRSAWTDKFWFRFVQLDPLPNNVVSFMRKIWRGEGSISDAIFPSIISNLARKKRFDEAYELFQIGYTKNEKNDSDIGRFDASQYDLSFEWQYRADGQSYAQGSENKTLYVQAEPFSGSVVAKRLVHLNRGPIRIAAIVDFEKIVDRDLRVVMRCASNNHPILDFFVPAKKSRQNGSGTGIIDNQCTYQWIEILVTIGNSREKLQATLLPLQISSK